MEFHRQEKAFNPRYAFLNQNINYENMMYPNQMPNQNMGYNKEYLNGGNTQYGQQFNVEQLPTIYTKKVEIVKETTKEEVKYFEPIQLSDGEDINQFLKNGLMKQIAPKIMALKQETQQSSTNNPLIHTEVTFDLKQNDAIYGNQDQKIDDDDEQQQSNSIPEKEQYVPSYMNSNYIFDQSQRKYDMSENESMQPSPNNYQFGYNQEVQEGPNGIKYSSVLPPKFELPKVINLNI